MILSFGTEKKLSFDEVKKSLLKLFPDYIIFAKDPETLQYPEEMNWKRLDHVCIEIYFDEERKDFQHFVIIETGALKEYDQEQSLHIGRNFSEEYNIRTLVGYVASEHGPEPGISILFDQGKSYLADDYWDLPMVGSDDAEGIRILREFEIPRYLFDSTGDCIGILPK